MRMNLLLLLFLLLSAACTLQPDHSTTATHNPVQDGKKVIPFFTTESDAAQVAILSELIEEYQELHPDVEIEVTLSSPTARERRLLTTLASGSDPGIFEIEPALMSEWAQSGYLLALDDIVEAIGMDEFAQGSLFQKDNHTYAVPYASSVYGLWVRTDLLEQVDLDLPQSYGDLLHAAQKLTKDSQYGIGLPGGMNIATVNYFSVFLWQNGGAYITCDGTVRFGDDETIDAIQKWNGLAQYSPPGFTTWGFREQLDAFTQGHIAMVIYAGRLGMHLYENNPDLLEHVQVIFPPLGNEPITLGVWSRFAIAADTQHPAEAKAFLQWLVSGDRLLRYDSTVPGHMIPPLPSLHEEALALETPYALQNREVIENFYAWLPLAYHPTTAMTVNSPVGTSYQVPPFANEVFGSTGLITQMLQDITLNNYEPDVAWRRTTHQLQELVDSSASYC